MGSPRRLGAPDARNRTVLLDAAVHVMAEEGVAAMTSRRIAAVAGLKPQLVHYYFRRMDDLYLELFRRRAEEGVLLQQEALAASEPLRAMWSLTADTVGSALTEGFLDLARRHPELQTEMTRYAERFRHAMAEAVRRSGADRPSAEGGLGIPATVLAVVLTATARILAAEDRIGLEFGHAETMSFLDRFLAGTDHQPTAQRRSIALG